LRVIGADATGELEVPVELSETDEADVDGPRCLVAEGDGVRAVVARLSCGAVRAVRGRADPRAAAGDGW
ncbi:hypothetical protein GKC44_16225, partial [Lactobacillus parabuchneri]|nr:hypothetical protein [Lentilactobacillus parabuchneri]